MSLCISCEEHFDQTIHRIKDKKKGDLHLTRNSFYKKYDYKS